MAGSAICEKSPLRDPQDFMTSGKAIREKSSQPEQRDFINWSRREGMNEKQETNRRGDKRYEYTSQIQCQNSGHWHLADYHEKFGHWQARVDSCGRRRSRPFTPFLPERHGDRTKQNYNAGRYQRTTECVCVFAEWVPATGLFYIRRIRSPGQG